MDGVTAERFDLAGSNVEVVEVASTVSPARAAAARSRRSISDMLRFSGAVARSRIDAFWCPAEYTYFPLPPRIRSVVTVHDTIATRYPKLAHPSARDRLFWDAKVRLALWQADLILTVSDYSARDIRRVFGVAPSRIRVAVEAPAAVYQPSTSQEDVERAAASHGVPPGTRWFIYLGGFNPHKHVDVVVRSHAAIVSDARDRAPHLLIVGPTVEDVFHADRQAVRDQIRRCGTEDLVHWTGFVPDEQLRHLLSGAVALVFPSRLEGFGLPAVEAAACGTPVVATRASPLPELLEDGGIFVEPGNEREVTDAMRLLLADEEGRLDMGRRALDRARQLSWRDAARVALDALHEVAA
jgi:alpha-1,3-rhamnosyl/mannosyltransferase